MALIVECDMDISEHVKRQAMDAVSHYETTAMIRAFRGNGLNARHHDLFTHTKTQQPDAQNEVRLISDDVRRQADAILHPETKAMIRLLKSDGEIKTPRTPSPRTSRIAQKIVRLHQAGQDLHLTQRQITQDHFGREK